MAAPRPKVVLLQLEKVSFFDEMYADLVASIRSRADVQFITSAEEASTAFQDRRFPAVFATDEALSKPKYRRQKAEAALFVRDGGTIIFGANFSSFSRPPEVKSLFSGFALPWETGSYHRTELSLNPESSAVRSADLAPRYSQKALHLKNVRRTDAVYLPTPTSCIESRVFAPTPVEDLRETPAALTSVGQGKVGYLGDVNGEPETDLVVLAMLGLN